MVVKGVTINILWYADDTVLPGNNINEIHYLLAEYKKKDRSIDGGVQLNEQQ